MGINELFDSIKDKGYYAGQITDQRVLEGKSARTADLNVSREVYSALQLEGIDELYQHQADAISAVRDGDHIVVATPTASGKSMTYTIPAVEQAVAEGDTTLYIAPQIALLNDQEQTLSNFGEKLGFDADLDVAAYHSKIGQAEKDAIKSRQPDVLLTTPDQLHLSVLPYGKSPNNWRWLFNSIKYVVIDEVHHYRGIFGSHVSLIFRRLNRLADQFGQDIQYICCSATIGNPVEHAAAVTGQSTDEFELINTDHSATGDRHWTLWNPPVKESWGDDESADQDSETETEIVQAPPDQTHLRSDNGSAGDLSEPQHRLESTADDHPANSDEVAGERRSTHQESIDLLIELLEHGYQTLVFTRTRQGAERYAMQTDSRLREAGHQTLAENVCAYHGNVDDQRRSGIEHGLKEGDIRGVWSTNALELGIDVGTLDAVILDGYPGSVMSTFQRAGRAGRGDDECAIFLVGSDNPLDQHIMQNPEKLFDEDAERAVVNTKNKNILPDHIVCAAREHHLTPADEAYFGDILPDIVTSAEEAGRLRLPEGSGGKWYSNEDNPNWDMRDQLRSIDERKITLRDQYSNEVLSKLGLSEAIRDCHPQAVYHHRKSTYQVTEVDYNTDTAYLKEIGETSKYTQPLHDKEIDVHDVQTRETLTTASAEIKTGVVDLTVAKKTKGYLEYSGGKYDTPTEKRFAEELRPPAYTIDTEGLFISLPDTIRENLSGDLTDDGQYVSGLHALEHAMISLLPREVLCDRRDIGGLSTNYHDWTDTGTIYIHDGYEGGVGLSAAAHDSLPHLLKETYELIANCPCDEGCPSCIHIPHCGNGNRKLSKQSALVILRECLLDALNLDQ